MIRRVYEYVIRCDGPDCQDCEAFCVHTRKACEEAALKYGWKPCTYKRWLCPTCVRRAEERANREAMRSKA